jgi:hypothetical protein
MSNTKRQRNRNVDFTAPKRYVKYLIYQEIKEKAPVGLSTAQTEDKKVISKNGKK